MPARASSQAARRAAAAALLAIAGGALAASQAFGPLAPGTGLVAGQVTAAATGQPIAGATVTILEFDRGERAEATTAADGRYGFDAIAGGSYRVHVRHEGYVEQIFGSSFPVGTDERRLVLGEGGRRADVDFALAAAGVVRGRVTADGAPLAGAVVLVGRLDTGRTPSSVAGVAPPATTDGDGRYEIGGLPAGAWHVEAYAAGQALAAQPGGVAAFARTFYPGVTQPELALPIQVEAGQARADVDVGLVRTRFHVITAVVPPELAAPAAGLEFAVGSLPPGTKFVFDHRAVVGDGTIRVFKLRPGRYVVWARALVSGRRQADWRVLDVHSDPPPFGFVFAPTGRLAGRLVAAAPLASFDGARVIAALAPEGADADPLSPDDVEVAPGGQFAIEGLFGPRALRVVGLPPGWRVQAIRRGGVSVTAPIEVRPGEAIVDLEVLVGPAA
ncbi:MAG: carboxypeptidase regulatory-like domain-containing protein [Vicinamibacterales bacterium]